MFACFRTTRQEKLYICNPLPLQSAVCALCEKTLKRLTAISVPRRATCLLSGANIQTNFDTRYKIGINSV